MGSVDDQMRKSKNERVRKGLTMLRQGIYESMISVVSERVGQDFETVQDVLFFHPKPIQQTSVEELVEFFNTNFPR
jgi:hypothetical protein